MQRLSTNLTLFLKFFIPIGWFSFFGIFAIVIFAVDTTDKPLLASSEFRMIYMSLFVLFFIALFFTFFQLMRVEGDKDSLYATNYFKTVRYPFDTVKKITVTNFGLFKLCRVHFHVKGYFGKSIPFIAKSHNLEIYKEEHPQLFP